MSFWTSNFWSPNFWTSNFWSDGVAPVITASPGGDIPGSVQTLINGTGGTFDIILTNDTWIAAGTGPIGTTDQSNALRAAMTSAQSEVGGWNAKVRDVLTNANLTRVNDTTARLTVPATGDFVITADETISTLIANAILTTSTSDLNVNAFMILNEASAGGDRLVSDLTGDLVSDITDNLTN